MKQLIISTLFIILINQCSAQTYIALYPSLSNGAGTLLNKTDLAFEVGRQWEVFSVGADIGKTSMEKRAPRDTTLYLEIRPNLNIFQQGKFTNTLTLGIGCIFNAKENFITEFTTGIEYSLSPLYHFNLNFGQYYFSGVNSASTGTYFGISVMRYFHPAKTGAMIMNMGGKKS